MNLIRQPIPLKHSDATSVIMICMDDLEGYASFSGNLDNNIKHKLELDLIGKHDSDSGQMEQVALVPHAAEVMEAWSICSLWDIELSLQEKGLKNASFHKS